ncbi:Tyrosine recombinase XerC [subsurface metagenome]
MRTDCPQTLDSTDSEKLLDVLLSNGHTAIKKRKAVRNHCMALLMLDAGLRVGELVSLQMSDLYFNNVPVRNIIIKPHMTKNKVEHSIPVSDRLSDSLRSYFSTWFLCDLVTGSDFAFTGVSTDRSITTRGVEKIICAAGWKVLGRPIHPHILRHTFASRLMRITNSSTVQQLLGHKHLSSTQVYCHPNEDDKRLAIESASHPSENRQPSEQPQQDLPQPAEPVNPGPVPASQSGPQSASHW